MSKAFYRDFFVDEKQRLRGIFSNTRITESNFDIPQLLLTYLGIEYSKRLEREVMEMRKEFIIEGYKFAIGIIDPNQFTVGFLTWPGIRGIGADELRKYRYAMFQAQLEMKKMQHSIEDTLRKSLLG